MSMTREQAIKHIEDIRASALKNLGAKYAHGCEGYYKTRIELSDICLTALRPVIREQIEKVWRGCKHCGEEWGTCDPITNRFTMPPPGGIRFCPMCGAPLTDEAVQMMVERLEAMKDGNSTD